LIKRVGILVFALALVLVSAGPAQAAKRKVEPKLSVSKVGNPQRTATAGGRFVVDGTVRNRGRRAGKGRVRVYLSTTRGRGWYTRGRAGAVQVGAARVRVPARKRRRFGAMISVPDTSSFKAGRYFVVACVRQRGSKGAFRCRSARRQVAIAVPVQPGPGPDPTPDPPVFSAGARTLGDPILPQLGNGGYDATKYDIGLDFDPTANAFDSAVTTMTARATQNLSEFSLDFQDLAVQEVLVNGQPAGFSQVDATPDLSSDPSHSQPMKLVVTPQTGITSGSPFTVQVDYSGAEPEVFTDPDSSIEGWIPATPTAPNSFFVVGEPIGSQAWFPSNNHPSNKAAFDTEITVPTGDTAFGAGELAGGAAVDNGDGTSTWRWSEDDPTATYLVTASNGDFDYAEEAVTETLTGRTLPIYNAVDSTANVAEKATIAARLGRTGEMMNFLADRYGPYPFDSNGALVDRTQGIGYALEVQGKSHYPSLNPGESTILHEISHQWFGNSATLERWNDIWFNEGWAQLSEWLWNSTPGSTTPEPPPEQQFDTEYADPTNDWSVAPAVLDNDPALLFSEFPTYTRGAMTIQGYREIVGDAGFRDLARRLQGEFAYGNVTTREFIAVALDESGLTGADRTLLSDYFEQWLYGTTKPTITPDDF